MLEALGKSLREAREARGLTLEDVEKATRIRARYLEALEAGQFEALPSAVQARGFLRNYARHVGLDPSETMTRLEEALHASRRISIFKRFRRNKKSIAEDAPTLENGVKPLPVSEAPPFDPAQFESAAMPRLSRMRRLRQLITVDAVIIVALFFGIVTFFIWGGSRVAAAVLTQPEITATPQVIGPAATPTILANITFTPTAPPPLTNFSEVQLELYAEQRAYVRVTVDGEIRYEGLLAAGEQLTYSSAQLVEVTTGNAAGVRIVLNGSDFGTLGEFGEVVTHIYEPNGWVTPTPSITPTPSETPDIVETLPVLDETEGDANA